MILLYMHFKILGLIPYRLLTFYEHTPPIKVWNVHFVVTGFNNSDVEVKKFASYQNNHYSLM